jgi:hypothetical protein
LRRIPLRFHPDPSDPPYLLAGNPADCWGV